MGEATTGESIGERGETMATPGESVEATDGGETRRRGRGRDRNRRERPDEGGVETSAAPEALVAADQVLATESLGLELTSRTAPADAQVAVPLGAAAPASTAIPASVAVQPTESGKVEPFLLPLGSLQAIAESAGLQWVNSDTEKMRAAQEAIASEPRPVHVPRERKPVARVDTGPLVLVETRKDLAQIKLPFEQSGAGTQASL
jgi:ribonuclease E